jgi:hypothetical protein
MRTICDGAEFDAFHHVDLHLENDVDVWAGVTGRIGKVRFHGITSMRMALRQSVNIQGDQGVITLTAPFNPGVYSQAEVHVSKSDMTVENQTLSDGESLCASVGKFPKFRDTRYCVSVLA